MKHLFMFILFLQPLLVIGQNDEIFTSMKLEVGYVVHFNSLNKDDYLSYMYPNVPEPSGVLHGLNIKVILPTKIKNIESFIGSVFLVNGDQVSSTGWTPGNTNSSGFIKNGGGVFAGLSPGLRGKHIGVTSDFAVGIYSFKEYFFGVNSVSLPFYEYYEKKASYGLGAMSSIGVYGKIGPVGLHPQAQVIFSGGNNASFLFYGFVIPLTIQF
jgi:hypothetical protein